MHVWVFSDKSDAVLVDDNTHLPVPEVLKFSTYLKLSAYATNTRITYVHQLCKWYIWCEDSDIDPLAIFTIPEAAIIFSEFCGMLESRNLKASSINLCLAAIYKYYDFLALTGIIEQGPYQRCMPVIKNGTNGFLNGLSYYSTKALSSSSYVRPDPSHPASYISWTQYEQLVAACTHIRDEVLIGLMFECGLRVGETLGIHIEDIELENNLIHLKYRETNSNHVFVKRRAERSVVLSESLAEKIFSLLLELEDYDTDHDFLFITMYSRKGENGRPLSYTNAKEIAKTLSKKTGIKFHLHQLRHGYAQERKMDGWEDGELARTMGHASVASTRIYADFPEEMLRKKSREYLERRNINDQDFRKNKGNN